MTLEFPLYLSSKNSEAKSSNANCPSLDLKELLTIGGERALSWIEKDLALTNSVSFHL